MSAPCFIAWSAATGALATPATAVATSATSGTPKTILQILSGANKIRVVEWGYMINGLPPAPVTIELLTTGTTAATVTAGTITQYNDSTGPGSLAVTGTAATGFNASNEGTVTTSRLLGQTYENGLYFKQQYPLGREPEISANTILRVRATPSSGVAVNMLAYVVWEE